MKTPDKGTELKRDLGLAGVFAVATGAMISSGLFVLPGLAYAKAGPAMVLAYLLAGIFIIPSMMAKAELSTAMPKAGGTYFFIERSLGPVVGTFGGFANWFSLSFKSAFALVGIGAFTMLVKPDITPWQVKMIAVAACVLFTISNLISVRVTGNLQIGLVAILLMILFLYVARGFIATQPKELNVTSEQIETWLKGSSELQRLTGSAGDQCEKKIIKSLTISRGNVWGP